MELIAQTREIFGRQAKQVREQGLIPAELYGHGIKNVHLSVNLKEFKKLYKEVGESTMIDLVVDKKKHSVMIQEVATHPVTDEPLNIDFLQVRLDIKITTHVPLVFTGEAPAVKEKQGVLIKAVNEIEVEALPADMPTNIEVDLAKLIDIGDSIHIKDLKLSDKIAIMADSKTTIATVTERISEEKEAEMAAETDLSEIKAEGEEKKEGEEPKAEEEKVEEKPEEKKEGK